MFGMGSLVAMYKANFAMMQHFQYSLRELEDMIPVEREIYILMLNDHLEKEKQKYNK